MWAPFLGSPVPAGTAAPPPCICPFYHRAQPDCWVWQPPRKTGLSPQTLVLSRTLRVGGPPPRCTPPRETDSATLARVRGGGIAELDGSGALNGGHRPLGALFYISEGGFYLCGVSVCLFVFGCHEYWGPYHLWGGKEATDVLHVWNSSAKFWMSCLTFSDKCKLWHSVGHQDTSDVFWDTASLPITCHNIGNHFHTVRHFQKYLISHFLHFDNPSFTLACYPCSFLSVLWYTNKSGLLLF